MPKSTELPKTRLASTEQKHRHQRRADCVDIGRHEGKGADQALATEKAHAFPERDEYGADAFSPVRA